MSTLKEQLQENQLTFEERLVDLLEFFRTKGNEALKACPACMSSYMQTINDFTLEINKKQVAFNQAMDYCEGSKSVVIFAGADFLYKILQGVDKSRGYVLYRSLPDPALRIMKDWLDPVFLVPGLATPAVPLDKYNEFLEFFKFNFVDRKA